MYAQRSLRLPLCWIANCTGDVRESASKFIMVVYKYAREQVQLGKLTKQELREYLNEIIHSICFVGQLQQPRVDPEHMFPSSGPPVFMTSLLTAFREFRSHVPRRAPGSTLLDMVVKIEGSHNKREIVKTLALFHNQMLISDAGGGGANLNIFLPVTVKSLLYRNSARRRRRYAWGATMGNFRSDSSRVMWRLGRQFYLHPSVVSTIRGNRGGSCFLAFHPGIHCATYTCHMIGGCVQFCKASTSYWTEWGAGALEGDFAACEALSKLLSPTNWRTPAEAFPVRRRETVFGEAELLNALMEKGLCGNRALVPFDPSISL